MVIKIFYIAIALFSVAMVILTIQTPYDSDIFKSNTKIANTEMSDVIDFDINKSVVSAEYTANKAVHYDNRDEFFEFKANTLGRDVNNTLTSNLAIYQGDIITFKGNAHYSNTDGLNYMSDVIVYDTKNKFLKSDTPFIITQNNDKIIGKSVIYDLNTKQTKAKEVQGWIQER